MVETTPGTGTARISGVVRPRSAKLSHETSRRTMRSASTSAPGPRFLGMGDQFQFVGMHVHIYRRHFTYEAHFNRTVIA
jgi:hypothetical protein